MNSETTIPVLSDDIGDRAIIVLAAISLGTVLALIVAHSPLVLGLLVPALVLWLRLQRNARSSREGMHRLHCAVAAAIAQTEVANRRLGDSAHRASPRLHLVVSRNK